MGDQNLTPLPLHSPVAHLLLRSLHSLNKMTAETEWLCTEVRSTVDATIYALVCGLESSLLAEVEPGPTASYLAKAESQRSLESKLQIDLLTPDPSPCLRLILLNGLELGVRLDPSTETVQCLARALYSIVLSTRTFEAELVTFEELLLQLLSGDDSHLFQCLNLWLELEDRLHNCISTQQSLLKMIPDAHWAFARLAQTIGYSAHLLVDWIVSPETNCLTYLVRYLRRFRDPDRCRSIAPTEQPAPVSPQPTSRTMGNTSLPTETISHWPRAELKDMLQSVAHCLHTLNSHGNVPFNPLPLIRSINHALSVI
ncbi:hypothetical protein CLF_108093 [Clonorchis sinensis]|uniref:Protein Lines N-terminal domain-containing protein n=1 Tax=Clonorchis sinensis TaxID=79923 RepID=G7YRA3_CLOSI|nr:hypothetical protein CLF_108093 [Clonorchis sinensis]